MALLDRRADRGTEEGDSMELKDKLQFVYTGDCVSVVRCAYCKHYEEEPEGDVMMCYRGLGYTRPSDYCSRGERRENE